MHITKFAGWFRTAKCRKGQRCDTAGGKSRLGVQEGGSYETKTRNVPVNAASVSVDGTTPVDFIFCSECRCFSERNMNLAFVKLRSPCLLSLPLSLSLSLVSPSPFRPSLSENVIASVYRFFDQHNDN